jgi:hypothetical protein
MWTSRPGPGRECRNSRDSVKLSGVLMYRVYGDLQSGNCYKVKLLLNHLELAHEWVHVDVLKGQSRTEEFLRFNRNGKHFAMTPSSAPARL